MNVIKSDNEKIITIVNYLNNDIHIEQNMNYQSMLDLLKNGKGIEIIIKIQKSTLDFNRYNIVRVDTTLKKHTTVILFSKDDPIIKIIYKLFSGYQNKNIESHISIIDIKGEKITGQIVSKSGMINYVELNGKLQVPIMPTNKLYDIPIVTYEAPKYADIKNFLKKYDLRIIEKYYSITDGIYFGIKFSSGYVSEIKPEKIINDNVPIQEFLFNFMNLKKIQSNEMKNIEKIKYDFEIYNILKLELSEKISQNIDISIVKKIINNKEPQKVIKELYNKKTAAFNERYNEDLSNAKKKNLSLITWHISKIIANKLYEIIEGDMNDKEKFIKIKAIVTPLVKSIIKGQNKVKNETLQNNVRKSCIKQKNKSSCTNENGSILDQCCFENGKCKLNIEKSFINSMIDKICNEILNYPYKRIEILNGKIEKIVDKNVFIQKENIIIGDAEES
jgi:hypothetical protein